MPSVSAISLWPLDCWVNAAGWFGWRAELHRCICCERDIINCLCISSPMLSGCARMLASVGCSGALGVLTGSSWWKYICLADRWFGVVGWDGVFVFPAVFCGFNLLCSYHSVKSFLDIVERDSGKFWSVAQHTGRENWRQKIPYTNSNTKTLVLWLFFRVVDVNWFHENLYIFSLYAVVSLFMHCFNYSFLCLHKICVICLELTSCVCHRKRFAVCIKI